MSWDDLKVPLFAQWKIWWLSRHPVEVGEYSWSYLFERGKQIRPRLFCELWQYLCPERPPPVEVAFMIECVHVASLILDDLPWMDNALERRGLTTLHCKFSLRKALLLVHDVLELKYEVGQSYLSLHPNEDGHSQWIHSKLEQLWQGQWLDLSRSGTLYELAALKTGVLFECATEWVAMEVGLDSLFWREWGRSVGVLFQWVDDWEDREEDRVIQQRNAFNESYDVTLHHYQVLWSRVVQGIGQGWWERPFGRFMMNYFTKVNGDMVLPSTPLSTLSSLSSLFPIIESYPTSSFVTSQLNMGLLFMNLIHPYMNGIYTISSFPATQFLWTLPEKDWITCLKENKNVRPFLSLMYQLEQMIEEAES